MIVPLLGLLAMSATSGEVAREDAAHRADRLVTEQLNRRALQSSEPRLRRNDKADRDYDVAKKRYEQKLADWRRQVAACEAGDWSACD
jgi:hypothetical protein